MQRIHGLSGREAKTILHFTGNTLMLLAVAILIPIIVAIIYNEQRYIAPFLYSAVISAVIGFSLAKLFKAEMKMTLKSAMIFSTIIWLIVCALGALPYYFSGELSYLDAYFEAMSGFTTTGFSMYANLDAVSYTINFWRGFTQWIGGLGIIVIVLSILSSFGDNIMGMYAAEGRDERIFPSIRHTVRVMLYIYLLYTVISIVLFIMAGMPIFDSVFYAFSALSTGGFAMHNESIAFYNNIWIEIAAMIIMVIGATNFALHYTVLKGNWKEYFKDIETKVAYPLLILGTIIVAVFLYNTSYYGHDFILSLRYSLFQVVSALTTTGLQTASGDQITHQWAGLGIFVLTIIMIIGAGSCSTGGGIKWLRFGMMMKAMWWEVRSFLLPSKAKISTKIHHVNDMKIDEKILKITGLFVFSYLIIYIISVIIVLFYYPNISQVLFEVASALSNVGLSSGLMTSTSPAVVKIVFIINFWIGRLEIWPVLLFITIAINYIVKK